jgi:DNA-binding response OmpR family regulator
MDGTFTGKRPLRALLVDDDEQARLRHAKRLGTQGYDVTQTGDWESGIVLARSTRPEVIFVHLAGAGSPALDFLQKLRADDTMRHIPVSMLGGQGTGRLNGLGLHAVGGEGW